jgi:hypothetical protein
MAATTTTSSSTKNRGKEAGGPFKRRGGSRHKEVLGDEHDDATSIPKDAVPAAILPGAVAVGATQSSVKHLAATTTRVALQRTTLRKEEVHSTVVEAILLDIADIFREISKETKPSWVMMTGRRTIVTMMRSC